ncbi:MAG: methyltransferase [Bacteroidales bacterium]|jgi:tRNA1Val (adenine37-N6)-methyltransferase|nr:methyltransferase [Bacteroidales bacterium]
MAFRFKQFDVDDIQSTQRVGTDAMILGSWAEPGQSVNIHDIGTGCGVLALMMAQKSKASVDAVEIDQRSCLEAEKNFLRSPWGKRLCIINDSIQSFANTTSSSYDYIIANPPFFSNQLKSPYAQKNKTRHDQELTLTDLIFHIQSLLKDHGRFTLILPPDRATELVFLALNYNFNIGRQLTVYTKPGKKPKRILLEFGRTMAKKPIFSELTILDAQGKFTDEYLFLTNGFHNF